MNEGLSWLEDLAELWSGGPFDRCQAGHNGHQTMKVDTKSFGTLEVFDWTVYEGTAGYCEGDDEISKSLDINGTWEVFGTDMAASILQRTHTDKDVVLDFGSHIGIYTLQAARAGYATLAVDASAEHLHVLGENADAFGVGRNVAKCRGWIGAQSKVCELPPDGVRVRFLKSDLEGSEDQLLRVTLPLFEAGVVDSALLEVSPIFADHYIDTCSTIMDCGYSAVFVPTYVGEAPEVIHRDRIAVQLDVDQRDVLFTKVMR